MRERGRGKREESVRWREGEGERERERERERLLYFFTFKHKTTQFIPSLSNIDQRMIKKPEECKNDGIPCSPYDQEPGQGQAKVSNGVESSVHILLRDPPEDGGCRVEGFQCCSDIGRYLEIILKLRNIGHRVVYSTQLFCIVFFV